MDGQSATATDDTTTGRHVSPEQFARFEKYAGEIFSAFGMDLDTESTRDTPRRFIRALYDITKGYDGDDKVLKAFGTECRSLRGCTSNQVIQGLIPFMPSANTMPCPFSAAPMWATSRERGSSGYPN